jgi:hypothetical protein
MALAFGFNEPRVGLKPEISGKAKEIKGKSIVYVLMFCDFII